MDDSLHARLSDYLETCREQRTQYQELSETHRRQAMRTHVTSLAMIHASQSDFWAAQACAYRDVVCNLERLLGVQ